MTVTWRWWCFKHVPRLISSEGFWSARKQELLVPSKVIWSKEANTSKGKQCFQDMWRLLFPFTLPTNFHQYLTLPSAKVSIEIKQCCSKSSRNLMKRPLSKLNLLTNAAVVVWYTWVGSMFVSHCSRGNRVSWRYICINLHEMKQVLVTLTQWTWFFSQVAVLSSCREALAESEATICLSKS